MRNRILTTFAIVLLALSTLGWQTDSRARYTRLGHEMMCMCGCGQILLECNHVGCTVSDKMAKQLHARLDQGMSDDQVKQAFIEEYGTVVLAAPTKKGFDLVAWIMPFAVFGLGIMAVVWVTKIWNGRAQAVAAAESSSGEMDALRRRAREETEF